MALVLIYGRKDLRYNEVHMRVIAGKYKGRGIKAPAVHTTRPTTDRNKESMFQMLGPYFDGGVVLDLFAGSGGLGIEAMSRGCDSLYAIDHQYQAYKCLQENIQKLQITNAVLWKMDYHKALAMMHKKQIVFDIVILDPPYGKGLVDPILEYLVTHKMLRNHARILVEENSEVTFASISSLDITKTKQYGITAVHIFTYKE